MNKTEQLDSRHSVCPSNGVRSAMLQASSVELYAAEHDSISLSQF